MSNIPEKHANIPLFIPHLGCKHRCVFCDQNTISGSPFPQTGAVREKILASLQTLGKRKAELAFFGGSFTAIDRDLMISLLNEVYPFVQSGALAGVRLSTRPDAIDEEILDILAQYGVTAIELGVQSMDDEVLRACARGHTAARTEEAFRLIKKRGCFSLVGQMMLGLPASNLEKELYTAQRICEGGADGCRIYPTAVFEGTPLEEMMRRGDYTPLTLEEGVRRGAKVARVFEEYGVKILRMGLCAEEGFDEKLVGGCCHPAYGELVKSALFEEELLRYFEDHPPKEGKTYTVYVSRGAVSAASGYRKKSKNKIYERYRCRLRFAEKEGLCGRQILIEEG